MLTTVLLLSALGSVNPPALSDMMGGTSGGTRALRIIRLARLARLVKVMRLMKKMRDELTKKKEVPLWKLPEKFTNTGVEKLMAMTAMVTVTKQAATLAAQRELQALMAEVRRKTLSNKAIQRVVSSNQEFEPEELTSIDLNATSGEHMLLEASRQNSMTAAAASGNAAGVVDLTSTEMKATMMHLVMYEYSPLVQEAIVLLMTVHSSRTQLLSDVRKAHLLFDEKDIKQQEQIESQLNFITQQIEKLGLWNLPEDGGQGSTIAKEKMGNLEAAFGYLIKKLQTRNPQYEMGLAMNRPVREVQVILRDLELDTAFKSWRSAIGAYPAETDASPVAKRTRRICMLVNQLIVCFTRDLPENQERIFRLMPMLVADVELGVVGAAEVLAATVANNETVMRLLPADFPKWMLEALRTHGSTFTTLSCVLHVGRQPIKANAIR
jgi:hypothetical protein